MITPELGNRSGGCEASLEGRLRTVRSGPRNPKIGMPKSGPLSVYFVQRVDTWRT
jgi:hypothetical protein